MVVIDFGVCRAMVTASNGSFLSLKGTLSGFKANSYYIGAYSRLIGFKVGQGGAPLGRGGASIVIP